jgi:hypothetical protein
MDFSESGANLVVLIETVSVFLSILMYYRYQSKKIEQSQSFDSKELKSNGGFPKKE